MFFKNDFRLELIHLSGLIHHGGLIRRGGSNNYNF